jgi:FdrA protein
VKKILVEKDSYYDSVFLMLINSEVKKVRGVREAVVSMGTEVNTQLLGEIGFSSAQLDAATPNDLIIAVEAEEEKIVQEAFELARELLTRKKSQRETEGAYRPVDLDTATKMVPEANLLIISVPGRHAAREARKALGSGLHVMLFSDNVSLEEEVALKKLAAEKGLLMMGPDCGLQEVSCSINRLGQGISQAIGTGGRDLGPEVGGTMMLMGIEALKRDPRTEVIVVISKPPAETVARKVIGRLEQAGKPCVVHFIGRKGGASSGTVQYAANLEETAGMAVALLEGRPYNPQSFSLGQQEVRRLVEKETGGMSKNQRYLRGLYTGGTLADEALILFEGQVDRIYSNNQTRPELVLPDPHRSKEHSIVDLGDDVFTRDRPHPMIDPSIRVQRIEEEMEDGEVAVLLLDCVLGYGSHHDPAGAMAESILRARSAVEKRNGHLAVVASVTGTEADFQNFEEQKHKLEEAGCIVMPSNYRAALLALEIVKEAGAR